jgi:uncharacterized protein YkwD
MFRFSHLRLVLLVPALLLAPTAYAQSVEDFEAERIEARSQAPGDAEPADASAAARLIVEKTNAFRLAHDRSKVTVDPQLAEAAQYFATYMATNDQYGHKADGNLPSQRAMKFGYDFCLVSENIAYQFSSAGFATEELAERFVDGWKNSPGHRKNMLDGDVLETGVAVARSGPTGYWYAVQMFGRPASAAIEFEIANRADAPIQYTIGDRTFDLPPRYTRTHTQCRSSQVAFDLPKRPSDALTVQPEDGDHYTIVGTSGELEIQQGKAPD